MKYYFDIEFIRSFNNSELSEFVYEDFRKFVKDLKHSTHKQIECIIFHDEELELTDIKENNLYEILCDSNLQYRKKEDLLHILEDEESTSLKFFFIDTKLKGIDIPSDFGFYTANSKNLNWAWEFVSSKYRDTKYLSDLRSPYNISSWDDLNFHSLPLNSIVISDRHFLKNRDTFDINLFPLLKKIGIAPLKKRKVDIVIISEEFRLSEINENSEKKRENENKQFNETAIIIQNYLDEIIGEGKYNFTLIKIDKTCPVIKPREIHDRYLFTNIRIISPHNSFDFFKRDKGKIVVKSKTKVPFDNFLWDSARGTNQETLCLLKKAFEKVNDIEGTENVKPFYRVAFNSEKICRLFN